MGAIRIVRASVGFLAGAALIGMTVAQFWVARLDLKPETVVLLLLIIGTMLGVDTLSHRLPLELTVGRREDEDEDDGDDDEE